MIFSWLRNRRRKRILAGPFPTEWAAYVERGVPHFHLLTPAEQTKLLDDVRVFVAEKNWEGCGGLVVTEEMKVTVAAAASLMTVGLPGEPFRGVLSILIYPAGYAVSEERQLQGGTIRGESARLGEAWYRGPVILSWAEIEADMLHPGDGSNLVWHEFAHQIDMLDRDINGTPPLSGRAQRQQWHDVMTAEFEQLKRDAQHHRPTLLNPYGTTNEGEFFAVATECFFDCPQEMRQQHPRMYKLLQQYYRQDPAARAAGDATSPRQMPH